MHFLTLLLFVLTLGCVKEQGQISAGATDGSPGGETTGTVATGSDPLASQAWHLENTGVNTGFSLSTGTMGKDINVKDVHTTMDILGRGIRIAISDSGSEVDHEDLADNALSSAEHRNYTLSNSSEWLGGSPFPSDNEYHGTAVAGLIAAVGWNGLGSRGVAPSAEFAAFRFLYTSGSETDASFLVKEIDQTDGNFDIFNYSYGNFGHKFVPEEDTVKAAIELGVTTLRGGKGTNYIQSAGNSWTVDYEICDADVDPLCAIEATGNTNSHETLATPYKIVVGAVDADGVLTSYSTPGSSIWISAPAGEDGILLPAMVTTDITGCNVGQSYRDQNYSEYFNYAYNTLNLFCKYTNQFNGTSSAAPVVSGVVALMLEANEDLTWRDVKHILAYTADTSIYNAFDINTLTHPRGYDLPGYDYDEKWVPNTGGYLFSNWYGFGTVDAEAAVTMAQNYNLSTLGTFVQTKNAVGTYYYDSGVIAKEILDEDPVGIVDQIWVGHNYIIEAVQIHITTDHVWPGDLAIHLESPSGTESRLLNINNKLLTTALESDFTMLSNAFYGENAEGYWKLKIYDGDSLLAAGDLTNWKILISGHRATADLNKPLPPTFLDLDAVPISLTETPVFSFSDSESSVFYYEAAVGLTPDDEDIESWTNIGTATTGQQLTGLSTSLIHDATYYLKVRARNAGGFSSVQVQSWVADNVP